MGEKNEPRGNTIDFFLQMEYDINNVLGVQKNLIPARFCCFVEHFRRYCVGKYRYPNEIWYEYKE